MTTRRSGLTSFLWLHFAFSSSSQPYSVPDGNSKLLFSKFKEDAHEISQHRTATTSSHHVQRISVSFTHYSDSQSQCANLLELNALLWISSMVPFPVDLSLQADELRGLTEAPLFSLPPHSNGSEQPSTASRSPGCGCQAPKLKICSRLRLGRPNYYTAEFLLSLFCLNYSFTLWNKKRIFTYALQLNEFTLLFWNKSPDFFPYCISLLHKLTACFEDVLNSFSLEETV